MDDFGLLSDVVPEAIKKDAISMLDVHQWPVLAEYRELSAFAALVSETGPTAGESDEEDTDEDVTTRGNATTNQEGQITGDVIAPRRSTG